MYSHCIYCTGRLGSNPLIERFPVGRRLAFDANRGRLWVICPGCTRWNLTPAEERWEAIEECERLFSVVRRQVSTGEIALGVHPAGLELVQVGGPRRPEMAAWRYGGVLRKRRRRSRLGSAARTGAILFTNVGLPLVVAWRVWHGRRVIARLPDASGRLVDIKRVHAEKVRLLAGGDDGWRLRVPVSRRELVFSGPQAVQAAGLLLPAVNASGGSEEQVARAVREIEWAGGPDGYFAAAAERLRQRHTVWRGPDPRLERAPAELRLALEMAAHEESERRALEGELRDLEQAWRQAEEIAAIADDLLLPRAITLTLERLRGGRTAS